MKEGEHNFKIKEDELEVGEWNIIEHPTCHIMGHKVLKETGHSILSNNQRDYLQNFA